MELEFKDYESNNNKLSFAIKNKKILGITGDNLEEIVELIKLRGNNKGQIIIDNKKISEENINTYKKKIVYTEDFSINIPLNNIYEIMKYIINSKKTYPKNIEKKIKDSLKIVNLNQDLLNKNITECSSSELIILKLAFSLLLNPDILIIKDPFKGVDLKRQKKLFITLKKICEQYNKTIIFVTTDAEVLYKYTENIIIYKNHEILISGKTLDVYKKVDLLKQNNIIIPEIVDFTYQAKKKKKVRIDYHKDIRDIIKDIYKHV